MNKEGFNLYKKDRFLLVINLGINEKEAIKNIKKLYKN